MGAVALGGPDALRLILAFAGRSPLVDIAIAAFVIAGEGRHPQDAETRSLRVPAVKGYPAKARISSSRCPRRR